MMPTLPLLFFHKNNENGGLGFSKPFFVCIKNRMKKKKLEKLFRLHYGSMYRLAITLLHDEAESKDVVHDIFARLLYEQHDIREETAGSYLLTSVRNRCLNIIRNRKIQERVARLYLLDLDTMEMQTDLLAEELNALRRGIRLLEPPVCRDIIMEHFLDGETFAAIARRHGVSETTIYKHLRHALQQLRTHLNTL